MKLKKQTWFMVSGAIIFTMACTLGMGTPAAPTQTQGDQVGTMVATTMQAILTTSPIANTPVPAPTHISGIPISSGGVSFVIPNGLASGANPKAVAAIGENDGAPWEAAPAHLIFTLADYPLQDKFHEPRIFVYPAEEHVQVSSSAAEQIDRLKKILAGFTPMKETLPVVPFFNAGPLIAANIRLLPFENGRGVRALTQYAQYSGPINNRELFYHFQGLTDDGKFYIIAILPVTAPILPATHDVSSPVPEGGVPFPAENLGPNSPYYVSVAEKLNALAADSYTPSLNTIDALIQSILVKKP